MHRRYGVLTASIVAVLGLTTAASAGTVTIEFTQVNPHDGVYAGYYAGIYEGTVNGKSAQFVCDDFPIEINYNQTWAAYINTNNPLSTGPTEVTYGVDSSYGQPPLTESRFTFLRCVHR
jgi:hypothetical protein